MELIIGHQAFKGQGQRSESSAIIPHPGITLAMVAKGMRGEEGSNKIAAELVVNSFVELFNTSPRLEPHAFFTQATALAAKEVRQYQNVSPQTRGVVTCAAVLMVDNRLYTASLGNCRIYLLRQQHIQQISIDHTLIGEFLNKGIFTREQLEGRHVDGVFSPYCFGSGLDSEQPDFRLKLDSHESDEQAKTNQGVPLEPGDQILLCTFALHGSLRTVGLKAEEIQQVWIQSADPQQVAKDLVGLAKEGQGEYQDYNDVTIIVLKIPT